MANTNYDAISFKNKDIDKFATKFGQTKKDPEEQAKQDVVRTKGMTEDQVNLYNQKGNLSKKIYAKGIAKDNLRAEYNANKPVEPPKLELTPEEKKARSTRRKETVGAIGDAIGNVVSPILEAIATGKLNLPRKKNKKN